MKRFVQSALIAAAALTLVIAAVIGLFIWSFLHDYIDQSTGPTIREKAVDHCGIPLPIHASAVEYSSFAGGLQDGEWWVRFKAPVPECYSTAQAIFAARAKTDPHFSVPEFRSTEYPPPVGSTRLRTDWFDVDRIKNGVVAGGGYGSQGYSWQPQIWIDEERGIFYYHDVN